MCFPNELPPHHGQRGDIAPAPPASAEAVLELRYEADPDCQPAPEEP
ncbi:MAG: hypothetical protein HZA88_25200 [Verrucomicrobia bacterium]|nr:hypothetical protein [Verrucomicrobiota bacterium]